MKRNKFASSKVWVVVWAMALFTYIIVMDKNAPEPVYYTLGGVIQGYMGFNVWQKKIYHDAKTESEARQ